MSAILNSLNFHNFPIFQPILMKLVSKFMVYRALSDKTYLLSGLLSPLRKSTIIHVISPYFGGSSLFLAHFGENLPIWNSRIFLYILYISLFGISDLPTKALAFPSLFNHSPYFETKISLFDFRDVSHVCQPLENHTVTISVFLVTSALKLKYL